MCKKDGNWASEWDTSHWIANNEDLADWSVSLFLLFEGFYSSTSLFNTHSSFSFFLFYSLTSHLRTYLIITVVFMASWKKNLLFSLASSCSFYFLFSMLFHSMIIIFTLHTYVMQYMMRFLIFILHICYFYVMMRSCHYKLLSGVMKNYHIMT